MKMADQFLGNLMASKGRVDRGTKPIILSG